MGQPLGDVDWYPLMFRLQAFYHTASPMVWKHDVPLEAMEAALVWMPVIEAEQNFRWADVTAVGAGHFKNQSALNRVVRPWRRVLRQAQINDRAERAQPTKEAYVASMAMVGIEVVAV